MPKQRPSLLRPRTKKALVRPPRKIRLVGGGSTSSPQVVARIGRAPVNATLMAYKRSLLDPWYAPPVKLGFGTFTPSSIRSSWRNYSFTPAATATSFAIVATPYIGIGQGTGTALTKPSYLWIGSSSNATDLLSAATGSTFTYSINASNAASVQNYADSGRVVSAALRVTVRYAATAVRGSLAIGYAGNDQTVALAGRTYTTLSDLFSSRRCSSTSGGEIAGEVQYRPLDPTSFEFNTNYMINGNGIIDSNAVIPQLYVVGTGWVAGSFQADVSVIFHYETLSGLDVGADDADINTLAATGATIDSLAAELSTMGEPLVTNNAELTSLDLAVRGLSLASRMSRGTYRGNLSLSSSSSSQATSSSTGTQNALLDQ